jgi:hypothetical protein
MSAIDNTPTNNNFLSPLGFKFLIKKAPNVNFFIQKVNIPGIKMTSPEPINPFVKVPYPGEHLDFETLDISFKVDEDLKNYLEIHNWLRGLGKPENYEQYKNLQDKPDYTGDSIYSDISVISLSSTKMPNYEIVYTDSFPVSLSGIIFNTTDTDVNYLEASAVFKYTYYTINKI